MKNVKMYTKTTFCAEQLLSDELEQAETSSPNVCFQAARLSLCAGAMYSTAVKMRTRSLSQNPEPMTT